MRFHIFHFPRTSTQTANRLPETRHRLQSSVEARHRVAVAAPRNGEDEAGLRSKGMRQLRLLLAQGELSFGFPWCGFQIKSPIQTNGGLPERLWKPHTLITIREFLKLVGPFCQAVSGEPF